MLRSLLLVLAIASTPVLAATELSPRDHRELVINAIVNAKSYKDVDTQLEALLKSGVPVEWMVKKDPKGFDVLFRTDPSASFQRFSKCCLKN